MINSRKIEDLHPRVDAMCRELIRRCKAEANIELLVTSTLRDIPYQNSLYAIGRTVPGKKVTNAKGGSSYHNFGLAFDVVPVVNKKPVWDNEAYWNTIGRIGKEIGLEWGGDFKSIKDKPHFQYTEGLSLADLRAGKGIMEQ